MRDNDTAQPAAQPCRLGAATSGLAACAPQVSMKKGERRNSAQGTPCPPKSGRGVTDAIGRMAHANGRGKPPPSAPTPTSVTTRQQHYHSSTAANRTAKRWRSTVGGGANRWCVSVHTAGQTRPARPTLDPPPPTSSLQPRNPRHKHVPSTHACTKDKHDRLHGTHDGLGRRHSAATHRESRLARRLHLYERRLKRRGGRRGWGTQHQAKGTCQRCN